MLTFPGPHPITPTQQPIAVLNSTNISTNTAFQQRYCEYVRVFVKHLAESSAAFSVLVVDFLSGRPPDKNKLS